MVWRAAQEGGRAAPLAWPRTKLSAGWCFSEQSTLVIKLLVSFHRVVSINNSVSLEDAEIALILLS